MGGKNDQKLEKCSNGVFFSFPSMACEWGLLLGLLSFVFIEINTICDMRVYMEVFEGLEAKNHKYGWWILHKLHLLRPPSSFFL